MAFKRMRELDGLLPVPELEPDVPKRVFVSYSWDGQAHKDWVRQLAEHLQQNGLEAQLDQWFMRAGTSAALFMEQGLLQADFILCVLTPEYARKANDRDSPSGTGYEQQIITGQILSRLNRRNMIPLLRKGTSQPDRCRTCRLPGNGIGCVYGNSGIQMQGYRRAIQDGEIATFRCDTQSRDSQAYDVGGGDRA
jgi:hypothetical protein